jgi:general secretion pathway protein D
MELPETMPIVSLLDLVGKHLQLDFMYDEKEVEGDVTLKLEGALSGPVQVKNLYPLLESVLKFRGYVMARRGDVVTVVKSEDWADVDPDLWEDGGLIEFGESVITRPFKLKHISTSDAETLLTSMKLGLAKSSIAENRTLIITAYVYRMPRIEALLDMVDQPGEPKVFRSRGLNYTMARNLTDKVRVLAEKLSNIEVSVSSSVRSDTGALTIPRKRATESTAAYNRRLAVARNAAAAKRNAAIRTGSSQPSQAKENVYLDADERTNSILMIGREEKLAIVQDLIDTLDVEQKDPRTPLAYEIKNVDAEEIRNKFQELGIIGRTYGDRRDRNETSGRLTSGAATNRTTTTRMADNMGFDSTDAALLEEPQVVVIEQTNSLLVRATPEQHAQIAQLIKYLDSLASDSAVPFAIYSLQNTDPEELTAILQKLIEETILDKEGKIESVVRKIDDEIVIVPDQNTFSLIVYASNRNQTWIKELITTLDKRRPQVLIDVTLVEVTKNDDFAYDLNIIESFPDLTSTSGLTSALIPGGTATNLVERLMNSGRDRFIDLESTGGSGTAFYGDEHINALLTAMENKQYGRIMARPKILVNDNENGVIITEDKTYVEIVGGALPQEGSQVVQTSRDYKEYSAGITLDIMPHISNGDLLRLDITLERSDFIPSNDPDKSGPPDTSVTNLNTVVTVPDRSTIILGGMSKINQSKSGGKVPILGDLPLIGGLFRSHGKSNIQKQLYIFVKVQVIRPEDTVAANNALVKISDRNREAFEKDEAEFQAFEGWPGFKPKAMGPEKILDLQ